MIKGIPKISILVITYKQEDIVGRTLDSLIAQKDYLYEICVSDDCSPDDTWQVLLDYQRRHPDLIKLHRNETNVGIFENTEFSWTMPTGDIVNQIAGDDTTPEGWYKAVIEFILQNKIDYTNELFCIYGDFKAMYPNGDSIVFYQNAIQKRPDDALRLSLRGIIGGRGCCFSINVLKQFDKVSVGRSHKVEHVQDRQLQLNAKKNYYIHQVGNIYYSSIGVSTQIQDEQLYMDRLNIWPYTIQYLENKNIHLKKVDRNFAEFTIAMQKFRHSKSLGAFLKVIWTYLISRDFSLPCGNGFRHLIFALRRRLPHKKVLSM